MLSQPCQLALEGEGSPTQHKLDVGCGGGDGVQHLETNMTKHSREQTYIHQFFLYLSPQILVTRLHAHHTSIDHHPCKQALIHTPRYFYTPLLFLYNTHASFKTPLKSNPYTSLVYLKVQQRTPFRPFQALTPL